MKNYNSPDIQSFYSLIQSNFTASIIALDILNVRNSTIKGSNIGIYARALSISSTSVINAEA